MGTHLDGPVATLPDGKLLQDFIAENNLDEIPFLFKVLSVGDALSIQTHPNSEQARSLHTLDPSHYPDSNPKPEASVALSRVELLYGFRHPNEIKKQLEQNSETLELLNADQTKQLATENLTTSSYIETIFSAVMNANSEALTRQSTKLASRLDATDKELSNEQKWFKKLQARYPADPGLFCFFLLNYTELNPGDSLFIEPGIVHAYLSGDMLECMANSNNVVRAGLTRKYRDVSTLLSIANFKAQKIELTKPIENKHWTSYHYPVSDFSISLLSPRAKFTEKSPGQHQIWLCLENTQGSITINDSVFSLSAGKCYFLPASIGPYQVNLGEGQVAKAQSLNS